jgi:3-hydroxyacyl-CoA dehydrogenase / enoyl-CoA hydratase / 3-hydroxybutyryl-CoA epimerase
MSDKTLKNWKVETDENHIQWWWFDKEKSSVNTFNKAALDDLTSLVDDVEKNKEITGVVIGSAKKSGFIAGADIEQFTRVESKEQVEEFLTGVHALYARIEKLKIPTVAMINGICLGGGTELSLSCDYRIADDDPKTKIGLPEIMLGIFPGWGGSVRLPRLIGAINAMGLMLTGRAVSARAAAKIGIIDDAVPTRHLKTAAIAYVTKKPKKHQASKLQALTNAGPVRKFLAGKMRKQLAAKKVNKKHYPAPFALVANWEKYGVSKRAFKGEIKAVTKLVLGDTAQNLIRVFFLQQKLKSLGKGVKYKPKHVHVIGGGTMGGDIAAWCAFRGMTVTLQDREPKFVSGAMKRAYKLYLKKLKKPDLAQLVMDRLIPDVEGHGVARADIVIEAIFEDLKVKQDLFKSLEERMKPGAIMATNTSSIPLDEINTVLKDPGRLVGIHFFNPVAKMPLVEVVRGEKTSDEIMGNATAFVHAIGKLPVQVKSYPGFLVNRVLMPYLMEALYLYQEGIPPAFIDKAALKFGMPMGPIELSDTVGLDVCLHVAKNLSQYFGTDVPDLLEKKVAAGELGAKSGQGFYKWNAKGKPEKPESGSSKLSEAVVIDRLILRMLNESVACLREEIVADKDLLDAGMIFGTGFAPFRGGPMHYAEHVGVKAIVDQLSDFTENFGDRFKPDEGWSLLNKE